MRIDAHQHFWIYDQRNYEWIDDTMSALRRDFLPADLKPELKGAGFGGSVVVQARQTIEETRWLLDLAESDPSILGVVGWVDLRSPQVRADLESIAGNAKLVGIRHVVQSEPDNFLRDPDFLRGISALEEFELVYDLLIYTKHLPLAAEFVKQFPRQRFVLDHLAKPPIKSGVVDVWAHGVRELASLPNVCAKLSGLVTEADWQAWKPADFLPYLDVAFECFGPGRLMIGSDWPVCTVAAPYERVMSLVKDYIAGLPADQREGILGGNAATLWRLKTQSTNGE